MSMFDAPPSGAASGYDAPPSPDPTCEVCGAPIQWGGKGRRPKYCDDHKTGGARKSSGTTTRGRVSESELNTACDSLHQLYDMLAFPMAAINPDAAGAWVDQIASLDARNRAILANNRDLVRKINSAGEKGGTFAFMLSHVVALAPPMFMIIGQARVNAADRKAQREAAAGAYEVPAEDYAFTAGAGGVGPGFFDAGSADAG